MEGLSGSWCIKETSESTLVMDSRVPLMHHDPDRSWITDPDGFTGSLMHHDPDKSWITDPDGFTGSFDAS